MDTSYTPAVPPLAAMRGPARAAGSGIARPGCRPARNAAGPLHEYEGTMLIRLGYDIQFTIAQPVPIVTLLSVHPSRRHDLQGPDRVTVEPGIEAAEYMDAFGNICTRLLAPPGTLRLTNSVVVIQDSGLLDPVAPDAREVPIEELPPETLRFLMASRFCEVDLLSPDGGGIVRRARRADGGGSRRSATGSTRKVTFSYPHARPTRTALDVFTERIGVCRDFQHLAVTFCRCLNIPARYATGYLGDIGVPRPDVADGFQRLVRGLPGGSVVDLRRAPQRAAHRPGPDRDRARRDRRGHHHLVRQRQTVAFRGRHRRDWLTAAGAGGAARPASRAVPQTLDIFERQSR